MSAQRAVFVIRFDMNAPGQPLVRLMRLIKPWLNHVDGGCWVGIRESADRVNEVLTELGWPVDAPLNSEVGR